MKSNSRNSVGTLALWITLFVVVGTPLVAVLWEILNKLMAGHVDLLRIAIAVPLLLLFYGLLRILAGFVQRWDAQRAD